MSLVLYAIKTVLSLLYKILFSYIKAFDLIFKQPFHRPSNGLPFIVTTLLGIVTLERDLHPLKAYLPMLVTLLGIMRLSRLPQPQKASSPILVTLF